MSNVTSSPRGTLLVGYILPPKREAQRNQDEGSDPEEDEEEEDDPEFLDMGEMESLSAGGHMFHSSVPPRLEVDFLVMGSGRTLRVDGRFPLTDPWWEVTCRVGRTRNGRAVLQGFPSYALRRDLEGAESRSLAFQFLTACGAAPEHVIQFTEWLPEGTEVGLDTLPELLEEFENVEKHKTAADYMRRLVSKSGAGLCVHAARLYPLVMKHLPTLLPRQFKELLGMGKKKDKDAPEKHAEVGLAEDLLAGLEEIIETDVWKLGFNSILYRELNLIRCEARLEAFEACGLFQNISELQRHALLVYDQLKRQCQRSGSTYVDLHDLEDLMHAELRELSVWEAVRFLKEEGVVVPKGKKVVLQNLYAYETGIGEKLALLTRGGTAPWRIELDVRRVLTEAQEERLRARAEAQAEAGKNKHGGQVNGTAVPEQEAGAVTVMEMPQDRAGVAGNGPREDLGYSNGETSTQAVHTDGGSSRDVTIDLTHSTPTQEVPGPEEPAPDRPVELQLDPDQVRAAEMICSNPVTVISGKGGCGKTTVVSLVFKAAMQQRHRDLEEVQKACKDYQNDPGGSQPVSDTDPQVGEENKQQQQQQQQQQEEEEEKKKKDEEEEEKIEVLLTAPTGRAAGLLTKRTGFTAYTMHQVLFSYMHWKKAKKPTETQDPGEGAPWKFRGVRALVVDEGSLVSVQILHSLLAILTGEARLQKLVLLGDVRQLPSIEPGNALYDLFVSLKTVHWSIEMRTNHRAESELIVKNAGQIADMGKKCCFRPLDFDAVVDLDSSHEMPAADRRFIYVRVGSNDCAVQDAISLLLGHGAGLQDHKNSQFIAFRRKDCALINELCCKKYVGHPTKNHKNRMDFQVGDKICCTRNNYVTDRSQELRRTRAAPMTEQQAAVAVPTQQGGPLTSDPQEGSSYGRAERKEKKKKKEEKEPERERLCNGEIFYITEDLTKVEEGSRRRSQKRYLTLDDGQGKVLCVLFRELQKLCRIQHAWARTIHTFQGSEAETIVYVVGSGVAQDWRHVYTAVTRGQKRVFIVSKDAEIERAIKGYVRKRNTRLSQLVRELVAEQRSAEEEPMSQSYLTQACLGFRPLQASQTLSQTPGPSAVPRDLKKECVDQDLDTSDGQAYGAPMEGTEDHTAVAKEKKPSWVLSGPQQSPVGSKRASGFEGWSTPPKQLRVASEDSPTGASSLRLLTLDSPSPAPVVKHLFSRRAGEDAAAGTPSPVMKFRPRVGLSERFAAAARCKEEGREGGAGPSSAHPQEASPSMIVPGFGRPPHSSLETSNTTVPPAIKYPKLFRGPCKEANSSETCLQDDLAFTQEYSWSPMGFVDDSSAMPHRSSVTDSLEVEFSKEPDVLQEMFN